MIEGLFWIGHSSFYIKDIKNDLNVYIDPFNLDEATAKNKADVILITHAHFDHYSKQDIDKIIKEDTEIVVAPNCLKEEKFNNSKILKPYEKYLVKGIEIETIPAYNNKKEKLQFHPKENNWVGFIININNKKIYHAGDTDFIDEMKDLKNKNIDAALLPMGGHYTMNMEEAIKAAESIEAKNTIPMHYKNLLGEEGSKNLEEKLKQKLKNVLILKEIQKPTYGFNK